MRVSELLVSITISNGKFIECVKNSGKINCGYYFVSFYELFSCNAIFMDGAMNSEYGKQTHTVRLNAKLPTGKLLSMHIN